MNVDELNTRSLRTQTSCETSSFLERIRRRACGWHVLHGILMAQLILMPCPPSAQAVWIEVDTDGDGIMDSGYDDGIPDPNDPAYVDPAHPDTTSDSDGDGLTDDEETAAGTNLYNPDSDYDGLTDRDEIYLTGTNPLASDSNGNGVSDYNEFYGNYTVAPDGGGSPETPYDYDGDGISDPVDPDPYSTGNDPDSDGDSIADSQDTDLYNTMVWCDYNRNGVNDDAEAQSNDQDGDGVSNETDSHPYDPVLSNDWNWNGINDQDEDWDGDGVSNLQDSHPNSNALWCDWNSNGVNDDAEAGSMDSDGDGHPDASDSHPYYSTLWNDWNYNGTNDEADSPATSMDSDADGHADNADSHPSNSSLWEDWNNNGVNDSQESTTSDSDSDGIEDGSDSDPGNPSLWSDWNRNGVNDGSESYVDEPTQQDSDADGHVDAMDSHPGNPGLWEDWNFNGLNDSTESYFTDSDGDGTSDAMDTHPSNPALWDDQNSNGVNDADEVVVIDSDGDGYADTLDTHPGDTALYNDHDNNGTNDELEAPPDDDADAMPDSQDPSPQDQDNDGLTDTEEYLMGTDPGEVDTDGDGLADGMEAYVGTDPLNVDTDGDGLTDFEELMAYHTDPLSATGSQTSGAAGGGEEEPGAAPGEGDGGGAGGGEPTASPGKAEIDVRLVMDAVTQESFDLRQGSLLSFPSTSGRMDQSDLKKTFVIQNSGSAPLSGLQFQLTGADQAAFEVSVLAADTLSPGSSATFTLTFKAPSASATKSLVASLLIASNDADESVFELQLVSVSGFWHAQRAYFFADLSDSDHDGIPDRVEDMYAPLVVTPDGDLDGDGVGNLAQYLAGLDLRGGSPAGDFDGDEISDAVEDAWSRHAPGALNKYRFKDAFQDPDGDGLLTLEEVNGWWGGRDDPAAVATHPFKNCTGPNNAGTAPTYNVAVRTPPLATGTASEWFNRESELSAWMNDGLLRLACRERGGSMTVAAFFASKYRYKKSGSSASYGYDHLPAGYLAWLGLNAAAIPATTSVLPVPPSEVAERIAQRKTLLLASDPDQDGMPSEWEAVQKFPKENVFCLDWRNPSDASLPAARTFLQQQISGLTERIQALGSQIATATATARQSLINQRTLLEVERTARQQVLDSRLGSDGQTGAVASPHSAMIGTSNVHQTLLIEPYLIAAPKAPAALANPPAETASAAVKAAWELKRDAWVTAFTNRLPWEILNKIDPDHDGLVNADEHLLGLSPRLPDYLPTGGRDSDGDGFTDAQELTAGTNHLDRTQFPPFTLHIISGSSQVVKIHQEFPQPLVLEARRADGTPQPGIALTVTTSRNNNLVLLSGSAGTDDWWPRTLQTTTGANGRATIRVKAPNTAGALTVTATAAIKTTTKAAFSTMVNTLIGDADGDGMPDAWETRAAQNGQPAHGLNKLSALDASASPLNHGYHRDTPPARLPQDIQSQLLALRDTTGFLSDYSSNTTQATDRFTTAQRATLALVDPDHDGWSNLEEHQNGTHPRIADNPATAARDDDQDGLPNLWEHRHGLNFNDARDADLVLDPVLTQAQRAELMDIKEAGVVKSYPEAYAASWGLSQLQWEWMKRIDPDHDGWTNLEEFLSGTNPRVADTTYLRVRRGGVQTAIAGQPLPEPVVVQAVREVVDSTGERTLDSVMADEEVTFSGPDGVLFRPGSGLAGSDLSQGANPCSLRTDEAGYLCVNVQAPAQVGRYTFFTSLGNGLKTALSLEVLPSETGGGPAGPGTPGGPGGPGEPGPNPPFELKWKFAQSSSLDVSVHRFDYMHKMENGEINTSSHAEVNDWKDGGTVSNYDFYPNASYSVVPSMGVLIAGSRPPNLRLVDPLYSESRVLLSCYSQANGYSQTEPGFKTVRSKVWQQTRPVLVAVTPGTSNQVALPAGHDVLVLLERIETKGGTLYEPGTPTSDTTYQTFTIHIDESGQAAVPESIMSQTGYIDSNDDNTAVTNTLRLLPIDLATDLNNDGQITSADSSLREAATKSGASDDAKEKGTEYLFINDKMSNGVWDADDDGLMSYSYGWGYDTLPKPPVSHKDDDDAEPLKVQLGGLSTGVVWFDHSVIDKLEFFKTKECKSSDKLNITSSSPYDLSTGALPETIYMRLRDDWAGVDSEGTLRMFVGKTVNETWAELKLPLTVVRDFGAKHFFHAARDYIAENNTRLCIRDHGYPFGPNPSVVFRLCVMREEATQLVPVNALSAGNYGIDQVYLDTVGSQNKPAVIINGSQCFFSAGWQEPVWSDPSTWGDLQNMIGKIADKCHGRVIRSGATAAMSSDNFDITTKPAAGSPLAGPDPIPAGMLAGPDGIAGNADDIPNSYAGDPGGKYVGYNSGSWTFAAGQPASADAVGGLSTNYASPQRTDKAHQLMGYAKGTEQGKGCVFTATQIKGEGYAPIFKGDASTSGVPALTPSVDAGAIKLLILDSGVGSLALMHTDPAGAMQSAYIGRKSELGVPYYVNNYLALYPSRPRP